jgi:hypothetical protein
MSKFKIVCLLLVTTISLQYRSIFVAYTVRFLPVWNPVMEGIITICTLPTVHTKFIHMIFKYGSKKKKKNIHSIFKHGSNVTLKNKVKIMDNAQNNYCNTQLTDIHLAPSMCCVKRHTIYKDLKKKRNVNSSFLKFPLQNLK